MALLTGVGGCTTSWRPTFVAGSRQAESIALTADESQTPAAGIASAGLAKAQAASEPISADAAFASVLEELREIGQLDPEAEQEVLASLKSAKPEHYRLIVEQYRAALAYRKQLAERDSQRALKQRQEDAEQRLVQTAGMRANQTARTGRSAPQATAQVRPAALHADPSVTLASDQGDPMSPEAAVRVLQAAALELAASQHGAGARIESLPPPPQTLPQSARPNGPHATPVVQATHYAIADSATPPSGDWRADLDATIRQLQQNVAATPRSVDEVQDHMRLRTLQLLAGRQEQALAPIPGASSGQQEFWSKQLFAMSAYLDAQGPGDEKTRAAATLAHLNEARDRLSELAPLQVRNATFVTRVDGFGLYEAAKDAKFAPGASIVVYAEIDNFRSRSTASGHESMLGTSYQVVDESGRRVDGAQFPDVQDVCQSRRHDFHMQYEMELPTRIYPGPYSLQIIITDHLSNKIGQADLAFEIVEK